MGKLLLTLIMVLPLFVFTQKTLRDSIYIKTDMFEIVYSEKLQQPKFIRYNVPCPNGTESRKGMDFYVCDSIITSDDKDYKNNLYDKGHLAPAANFSCTKEMLHRTFTYLNCSLQQEKLNRTTWRLLEARERELAKTQVVIVEIRCVYSTKSIVLTSGATIPDGYYKTIKYGKTIEKYYFKNEKPLTTDYTKYKIK
jgi:endonuclease G